MTESAASACDSDELPDDAPKHIELTRENYESIEIDPDDGALTLTLTDDTAAWMHSEGFRSTSETGGESDGE
jgi:hypothetical protein